MSLSRPVKFPLLKLPFLCIKCVINNSDLFAIIYFATITNRTRKLVQHSKYPLKWIDIYPSSVRSICMGKGRIWHFEHDTYKQGFPLVLQRNSEPLQVWKGFNPNRGPNHLESYTSGDTLDALKMGIDFMIDVFGCKIRFLLIHGNELSELLRLGISSVKTMHIGDAGPDNITDLKNLLESIKVTDDYFFQGPIPKGFHCDPQAFKCRKLYCAGGSSADWVTFDILCQVDVPQLTFESHRLTKQDIVSYVTNWFNSENTKLEYLSVYFWGSRDFPKIDHLNPMPFCKERRNRWSLNKSLQKTDLSRGKDILRKDGMLATLLATPSYILFYVWHKRFPDAVQR